MCINTFQSIYTSIKHTTKKQTHSTISNHQYYYRDELKITNASQFKYATDEDLKSIGMSRPEIRRLRKFYEKYFPHGYLSKIKRLLHAPTSIVKKDEMSGSGGVTQTAAASPSGSISGASTGAAAKTNSSPSKAPNNKHIIPADAISVNKQLGTGEFGIVQQGVWTNGSERVSIFKFMTGNMITIIFYFSFRFKWL